MENGAFAGFGPILAGAGFVSWMPAFIVHVGAQLRGGTGAAAAACDRLCEDAPALLLV